MKKTLIIVVLGLWALAQSGLSQSVQSLYSEAQQAYLAGKTEQAKKLFEQVVRIDPKHVPAQNYLRAIEAAEKRSGPETKLKVQVEALMVPEVSLKNATLTSVLDYLPQLAEQVSGGEVKLSFVTKLPAGYADEANVTLSLRDVPYTELLRYIGEVAEVQFRIEKYAILVKKAGKTATSPPENAGE